MKLNKNKLFNILLLVLLVLVILTIVYFFGLKQDAGKCLQNPVAYYFEKALDKDYFCSCDYGGKNYILTNQVSQSINISSVLSDLKPL